MNAATCVRSALAGLGQLTVSRSDTRAADHVSVKGRTRGAQQSFGKTRYGSLGLVLLLAAASCMPLSPPQNTLATRNSGRVASSANSSVGTQEERQERLPRDEVFPGTGVFVAPPRQRQQPRVSVAGDGGISFNFANADVRDVIREILGEQLHLDYVIDPKVQGTITAQTGAPVARDAVLSTFEGVLRANGLAVVHIGDLYRVLPVEEAAKAGVGGSSGGETAGFATRVLP